MSALCSPLYLSGDYPVICSLGKGATFPLGKGSLDPLLPVAPMPSTGSFCLVCIYLLPCGLEQGSSSGQQESQSVQHWAPIAVSFPRGRGAEPEEAGLGSVHQKPPGWGADFSGDTGCIFQGSWVPLEDLFSHLLSESYLTATEM